VNAGAASAATPNREANTARFMYPIMARPSRTSLSQEYRAVRIDRLYATPGAKEIDVESTQNGGHVRNGNLGDSCGM
jgi:hypothetical protein